MENIIDKNKHTGILLGVMFGFFMLIIIFIIVIYGVGEESFRTGHSQGLNEGYKEGSSEGYKKGYTDGNYRGQMQGISQGKNTAVNNAIECLNNCNTGTGIINECYSLNCIKMCFNGI